MKQSFKILVTIVAVMVLLCSSMAKSSGREYLPVLEDGKTWVYGTVYLKNDTDLGWYYDTVYYKTRVVGDTIVLDKPCKKLTVSGINGENPRTKVQYEENGKLYAEGWNCFLPLIDMNYEKGDNIPIYDAYGNFDETYLEVRDSEIITTTDGLTRKVLTVGWSLGVWVEGIGFNIDFETMTSFPITLNYQGTFMESCMKDDEVLFTKSDFDRIRNRHTGVEMSVQSESLTVTYSDGSVSAVCNGNEVSMELYSLEGKLIARTRNNDRASLETSTLPSGIYIAKAACGETSVVRKIAL